MIAAATRGNVSIYTIDPRGLATGDEDLIGQASTFPLQGAGLNTLLSELRLSQDSLRVLAEQTGGIAVVNQNDFDKALKRIDAETSDYYVLGYYSTNPDPLKKKRTIEIKVKTPGKFELNYKPGYTLKPPPAVKSSSK